MVVLVTPFPLTGLECSRLGGRTSTKHRKPKVASIPGTLRKSQVKLKRGNELKARSKCIPR